MKRTIYGISFIIACLLIALIVSIVRTSDKMDTYHVIRTHTAPTDYLALLKSNKSGLSLLCTTIDPNRPPIADFLYENLFYVKFFNYTLQPTNKFKIADIIRETHSDEHVTYDEIYGGFADVDSFSFQYRSDAPDIIERNINLNVVGTTRAIVKNDSVAYYFLNCEKFFVKYDSGDIQDIYAETEGKIFLPIEVMFLKRANHLFLIFMFGKDRSVALPVGSLDKLINSKGKLTSN